MTDLHHTNEKLRALFIVALMKQGATREDAERKATHPRLWCQKYDFEHRWRVATKNGGDRRHTRRVCDDDARAILEAHYERLWCGLTVGNACCRTTTYTVCHDYHGNNIGEHLIDKLGAILTAMQALYGDGKQ